jgi:hypothetical protein
MKNLAIIFLLAIVTCGCAQKNVVNPYQSKGTLTGYDLGQCDVCGGIKITIQNDTTQNAPAFYRIDTTLSKLNIIGSNGNTSFPVNVLLNWRLQPGSNPGHYITVYLIAQAK